jgi:SAM-dependent methyltransferase
MELEQDTLRTINTTTAEYAQQQINGNERKTETFLIPLLKKFSANAVLDVGCGVGVMVSALYNKGYDAYGVDLACVEGYWSKLDYNKDRFFVVDPHDLMLPFQDGYFDFVYSFGVIEHVGTVEGSTLLGNYKELRKKWLREMFRVVRPSGHLLIGGPNRHFPIDVAHGPDLKATKPELAISRLLGCTFHYPWRENCLWGYGEVSEYLDGLEYEIEGLSIKDFLYLGRVPGFLKPAVGLYLHYMPRQLFKTCFNPWMMALIKKH